MRSRWSVLLAAAVLLGGCSSSRSAGPRPATSGSPRTVTTVPSATPTSDAPFRASAHALSAATVELVQRSNRLLGWRQECTGTKVLLGRRTFVLTARHCIVDLIDRKAVFGSLGTEAESMTAPDLHRPVDVTRLLQAQLGIRSVDPHGQVGSTTTPVVRVVVQWYPDVALLTVERSAAFDAVPALVYVPEVDLGLEGHEAATAGIPAAAGKRLRDNGTYLGRVQNPSDPTQLLDLVGLRPAGPRDDACNYGASGSLAVIAPGSFTGPLALRNNVVNLVGSNGEDEPGFDRRTRRGMAEQLGSSLAGYPTICGYGELPRSVLDGLVRRSLR